MTVKLVGTWQKWTGLSTDQKPLYDASATYKAELAGSTFKELDTGKEWRWDGETWRVESDNAPPDLQLKELQEINAGLHTLLERFTEVAMKL